MEKIIIRILKRKATSNRLRVGCKKQTIWQSSIFQNAVIGNIAGQILVVTFFFFPH